MRGISVGHGADALLKTAQACACCRAHHAVWHTRVKTLCIECLLQLAQLVAIQGGNVAGPRRGNGWATVDLACQKAHAQRVVDGVVVPQDGAEIGAHQKRWAACSCGRDDGGRTHLGQGLPVQRANAFCRPCCAVLAGADFGACVVKASGQLHFDAPGLAAFPAHARQKMGRGRRDIGNAAPDVTMAVAVGIHGVGQKHRGQKLRVPHGARPGADHAIGRDVALVHDAQRGQQLGLRPGAAAPVVSQRGKRVHRAVGTKVAAVVALHAPDGRDHCGGYPVASGGSVQCGVVLRPHGLALCNALRRHGAVQVGPGRAGEFGLGTVQLHHARLPLRAAQHFAHGLGLNTRR